MGIFMNRIFSFRRFFRLDKITWIASNCTFGHFFYKKKILLLIKKNKTKVVQLIFR